MRILGMLLLIAGGVYAPPVFSAELPVWAKNQAHYARILNPIAAQVMAWIDRQQIDSQQVILLENAELLQTDDSHFRFELDTEHHAPKQLNRKTTRFDFIASHGDMPRLEHVKPIIVEQIDQNQVRFYNPKTQLYYRARELAYWWLAHLDGVDDARDQVAVSSWIENAKFESERLTTIETTTTKDTPTLTQGGHLLRTLTIEPNDQAKHYQLRLLIDWQGMLGNGKIGIASLEHIISIRQSDDGALIVERIVEHIRLPSLEPWTKILC